MKWLVVVGALAALLVGSCGGGDDGGGGRFAGTYFTALFEARTGPRTAIASWGTVQADGASVLTGALTANEDGDVEPSSPVALDFSLASDGAVTLFDGGDEVARGGISADASCVVLSSTGEDSRPGMIVLMRRSGSFSLGSLDGDYRAAFMQHRLGFGFQAVWEDGIMDGAGGFTGGSAGNLEGTLDGGGFLSSYTVAGDGGATLDSFVQTNVGGVLDGGDFALFGGGEADTDDPQVIFLVRTGTGQSEATLSGTYWVAGIEYDLDGGPDVISWSGSVVADGAGAITIAGVANDGTTIRSISGGGTYTVTSNGEVVLNRDGGPGSEDLRGGVTADGRFAVLSGGTVVGSNPVCLVLCRK